MSLSNDFDDEFASPREWVEMYRALGLQAVPAVSPKEDPTNFKRPAVQWKEHEEALIPDATIERWYAPDGPHRMRGNVGIITGRCSNGAFCVDLDVKTGSQADQWWRGLIEVHNNGIVPETPWQRTGGGGRQFLFRAPEGWSPPTFKTPIGIDIRGQGGFMVAPPSAHSSGKAYEWAPGASPYEIEIETAPEWLIEAIEKLKEEHARNAGAPGRERTRSAESKNAFGLDIDERETKLRDMVWAAVVDLYREAPIPPSQERQGAEKARLWQSYRQSTKSRLVRPGVPNEDLLEAEGRGWSELDRKWRYAFKKWDKEVRAAAAVERAPAQPTPFVEPLAPPPANDEAPDAPVVQPGAQPAFDPWERFLVPSFPLDALPPHLSRFVEYQAQSTGGDPAAIAMAALAACSGALDQRFTLKMKRTGDWHVRPRLWVVLVGDPSTKKTPIINACVKPLRSHEGTLVAAYQRAYAQWKADKLDKDEEPTRPTRFIFNDITSEKVGEILSRQDRGALIEHDELSGWIGAMDKYGGGKGSSADRSFWAQAYNGGPKTIDRLARGETYIQNLCVSFLGGIQPDRLSEIANLTSDGLLQRFLPVMMRRAVYPAEVENDAPGKHYNQLVQSLIGVSPATLRMDEGGLAAADEMQRYLFDLEGMDGLGKSFCTFVGKLGGVHGSLSLLLHMVEDPENSVFEPVSERVVRIASRIVREFIIPHALELYRGTTDGADWHALQTIASFVLTSGKDRLVPSDFTTGVRALRGAGTWDLNQKLSPLVAGGWLNEEAVSGVVKAWNVTAGLRESMAERREQEIRKKAELMKVTRILRQEKVDA